MPAIEGMPSVPAYDAELTTYDYPREVRFFALNSQQQELRMAYVIAEPTLKPNGQTVVLFHGKNFSAAYWEPTIAWLTDRGFRVIAPDQIGFGKSSKPSAYQFSFQALAQNTKALLDSLGVTEVALVGHSMGGMLATRFALMYPETVRRLALVNPIGLEDYKTQVRYRGIEDLYAKELETTPESIRAYMTASYFDGQWKPEYDALIAPLAGWTRHPDAARIAWLSAVTFDMIFTQPVVYELSRITQPTLLIIGQRDRTALGKAWATPDVAATMGDYPALGKAAAKAIPNAKLVALENVGHVPQVEAFDAYFVPLYAFLVGAPTP